MSDKDLYVLVCERDIDNEEGRPIVWEQYIDWDNASLESLRALKMRLGPKYGEKRIAKLTFVEDV